MTKNAIAILCGVIAAISFLYSAIDTFPTGIRTERLLLVGETAGQREIETAVEIELEGGEKITRDIVVTINDPSLKPVFEESLQKPTFQELALWWSFILSGGVLILISVSICLICLRDKWMRYGDARAKSNEGLLVNVIAFLVGVVMTIVPAYTAALPSPEVTSLRSQLNEAKKIADELSQKRIVVDDIKVSGPGASDVQPSSSK